MYVLIYTKTTLCIRGLARLNLCSSIHKMYLFQLATILTTLNLPSPYYYTNIHTKWHIQKYIHIHYAQWQHIESAANIFILFSDLPASSFPFRIYFTHLSVFVSFTLALRSFTSQHLQLKITPLSPLYPFGPSSIITPPTSPPTFYIFIHIYLL